MTVRRLLNEVGGGVSTLIFLNSGLTDCTALSVDCELDSISCPICKYVQATVSVITGDIDSIIIVSQTHRTANVV